MTVDIQGLEDLSKKMDFAGEVENSIGLMGLEGNARKVSVEVLNACLVDEIALGLALKQAHWNVKGPNFIAVHELLDNVHARVQEQVDTIAERVQILDGTAVGTLEAVQKFTELEPYPIGLTGIEAHLAELCARMLKLGAKLRKGIEETEGAGDADTADVLTAASRQMDKDVWFLHSHLE
ncbi:starvation-inducible DNA-binding protein [Rhodobacter aestuarii]|uniref:Starvation-inducible DNA-binding protein n=1 Tax=Rhodobacter aestuarii TaxID=453582 RepID=A0A1N7J5W7_9RHOB|nr:MULTISPECIES: DNA starvation/stationary phase protection protein Dps [Rhodobacter]PTV97153.1 starvation-inducible DNA-binding protein [Rhodobacter aestuarii]SIS44647.1 starvation-inducible DNA-binding protein [Rhodobacter aestuarii]SOB98739.1 starvation-inducible DNA-binding protein [Rhodobacter sp. JA431]